MADEQASIPRANLAPDRPAELRGALLSWYRRNRRELPWREVEDPYLTWVSEIMLQQTQVATVIDYYHRWLERFPTVEALASAEREEVLEMWAGLGYYRRARFLHESAKMVVAEMGGELPQSAKQLEKLKGVGPYTAGAIASIAFGEAAPLVDGNVERVFSRLFAIDGDPKATANKKLYWKLAGELVDPDAPGDFNQALMELGATVCTPQSPACMLCPLREHCEAFGLGDPSAYPETTKRPRQRPVTVRTCVLARDGAGEDEFLVIKRPADGLLGGLWEFPSVVVEDDPSPSVMDTYLAECLDAECSGADSATDEPTSLGEIVHHFSHIRMTIHAESRSLRDGVSANPASQFEQPVRWVARGELDSLAMSAAMRKVWGLYGA